MLGIFVLFLLSWFILYFYGRKSLLALGVLPTPERIQQFATGVLITSLLCLGVEFLEKLLSDASWQLNEEFTMSLLLNRFWWDFRSVLTEELLFRGAILYILIHWMGTRPALIISAVAFGAYHWFTMGILGNVVPMIVVFIGTGLMGYSWALAFAKTKSIYLPVGFHLGWNFTLNSIFSKGPLGNGWIISEGGMPISDFYSLVALWGVPVIVLLIVVYAVPEKRLSPENLGTTGT